MDKKNAVTQIMISISERCRCRACVKMTQTYLLFVVSFQIFNLSGGAAAVAVVLAVLVAERNSL